MDSKISAVGGRGQWLGYLGLALLVGFMFLPMSYYADKLSLPHPTENHFRLTE